ncbi:MAG: RNA polymerase factor sigma-54 [Prevotella sp.]|nr:RNA polymerase factor sigma-54 [Prevotella sp.]
MAQRLIQEQIQKQQQVQRLTAQQMLQKRLLEMPLTELEGKINAELDDNPALETGGDGTDNVNDNVNDNVSDSGNDDVDVEKRDELEAVLENMGSDDLMPDANTMHLSADTADYEEMVYGNTVSFYDLLKEQAGEQDLTERERDVLEYLIGSLDDDGLLRKDLDTISDELAIYHNIDATEDEVGRMLATLQEFDPAGIGARSLQECLLIQIDRKLQQDESEVLLLVRKVIKHYFAEFTYNHWNTIKSALRLSDALVERMQGEIRRLNPKPGASLGETQGRSTQQITPDFIVETLDNGQVTFYLNDGDIPMLSVSPSFVDMLEAYKDNKVGMNRQSKEALLYAKDKVERAQNFINAVKQRQQTLTVTMNAIIDWQKAFFQDGDEGDLRPMRLKDIAAKTGLDISTVSRVSNIKYVQTKWGTFPLRFFFSDGYTKDDGEELSTRKLKVVLKEIIGGEDPHHPLSDEALMAAMRERGLPIARRTVAKYREQMGIPVARMRRV